MEFVINPLSTKDRQMYPKYVLGRTTCPICNQTDIKVVNDRGPEGCARFNYLENHCPVDKNDLCMGSEQLLHDFVIPKEEQEASDA